MVILSDRIPTRAVLRDAALLHEEEDKILLLPADNPEVVKEIPAIHVKRVFDVSDKRPFASIRDMVVRPGVKRFGVRNTNGDLILLRRVEIPTGRLFDKSQLQEFRFDAAVDKAHRLVAPVTVDKPLAEITRKLYVNVIVAHCCKNLDKDSLFLAYIYIIGKSFNKIWLISL